MSRNQTNRRVDEIRARRAANSRTTSSTNTAPGNLSRRDFIRRGTVMGMSLSAVGFLASACGTGKKTSTGAAGGGTAVEAGGKEVEVRAGGTLKLGMSPGPATGSTRSRSPTRAAWHHARQTAEFLFVVRHELAARSRGWPRAGSRTPTARCGRSSSARA